MRNASPIIIDNAVDPWSSHQNWCVYECISSSQTWLHELHEHQGTPGHDIQLPRNTWTFF